MSWIISQALNQAYENSRCSQEQEAEYSAENSLDGGPFAPLNGSPTPQAFLSPDKMTAFSRLSRFGMTFAPLTGSRGEDLLTWFLEDFPAKTSAQPGKVQELTVNALECGWKWPESSVKFDPVTSSWKTRQCSLLEGLDEFSETWPRWGMMRDGECWELAASGHSTNENAFGFSLFTPTATEGKRHNISSPCWKRRMDTRDTPGTLPEQLAWMGYEGLLTPEFNERAMLWPDQWTALRPLETARFQAWLLSHGEF